jgi:Helix-turn-helix domain
MSVNSAVDRWLTPEELAERLGVGLGTIRDWRYHGYGPPGTRFGRGKGGSVRYLLSDVIVGGPAGPRPGYGREYDVTGLSAEGTAKGRLQRECLRWLRGHEADGTLPTSSRFIYYELKQSGYPLARHQARRDDQDVVDAVMALREAGLVPWDWISDETRDTEGPLVAASVRQWLLDVLDQARINPWPQGQRPLVICESRGVRAALRATARRYGALITSTNGQAGGFLRTDVAPLLEEKTPVAYLGDWNPAGSAIEANTRRVLEREAGPLAWTRLAITPEQAASASPPLPPKPGTDRRYRDGRPHLSYEAEALGQRELDRLLTGWLDGLMPGTLADVQERERDQRARLRRMLPGGAA